MIWSWVKRGLSWLPLNSEYTLTTCTHNYWQRTGVWENGRFWFLHCAQEKLSQRATDPASFKAASCVDWEDFMSFTFYLGGWKVLFRARRQIARLCIARWQMNKGNLNGMLLRFSLSFYLSVSTLSREFSAKQN